METEKLKRHIESRLAGVRIENEPVALSGGLINFVWRVPCQPHNIIVKYAAPYIAVLPDVALDPVRLLFEARSLNLFNEGGKLAGIAQSLMRPPHLLDYDPEENILILEDVGHAPDLGQWIINETISDYMAGEIGELIGRFVAQLHRKTYLDETLKTELNNATIQKARLEGQYTDTLKYLKRGQIYDAEILGKRAYEFGLRLQRPGLCMTMGDLWLPSILLTRNGLRIIDWEFAHFGLPAQDVGHFVAHLWMHIHRASSPRMADRSRSLLASFLEAYRNNLGEKKNEIFDSLSLRQSYIHFGCEILARTIGAYQQGYLYETLDPNSPIIQQAVQVAAEHIRHPEKGGILDILAD